MIAVDLCLPAHLLCLLAHLLGLLARLLLQASQPANQTVEQTIFARSSCPILFAFLLQSAQPA